MIQSEAVVETAKDGQSLGMINSIVDVSVDNNDNEAMLPPMIDTELDLKATLLVLPASLISQCQEQLRTWVSW